MNNEDFTQEDAFEALSNGHGLISIESAEKICAVLGIGTADRMPIFTWGSAREAQEKYGIFVTKDQPGSGVGLLELGYALCEALDIDPPGHGFTGKGFQARANTQAIREHLARTREDET